MSVRPILVCLAWMLVANAAATPTAPPDRSGKSAMPSPMSAQPDPNFELHLYGTRFDPLVDVPASLRTLESGDGPRWYLLQLHGPSQRTWLGKLLSTGVQPVQYIHPYTYIVWANREQIHAATLFSFVRWIGPFAPVLRFDDGADGGDSNGMLQVLVLAAHHEHGLVEQALMRSNAIIRAINTVNSYMQVIYLSLPNFRGADLGTIPGVYAAQVVAEEPHPRGEAQAQANVGGHDELGRPFPGYLNWLQRTGYDGSGITVAVVDQAGVRGSHFDLVDRIQGCSPASEEVLFCSQSTAAGNHATHVAGAIAGTGRSGRVDGEGFLRGLGVAPGVRLLPQRYTYTLEDGDLIPGGILAIFRESVGNGAVIANNSWGLSTRARGYDIPTMQVDMAARDADPGAGPPRPILPVWAIMNGRGDAGGSICAPGSLGAPDEAKNLLAVGATELLSEDGSVHPHRLSQLAASSGHGNACDGRRVPHLVAPGCSTDSTTALGDNAHSFRGYCGTSMAAPNVSGAAAIYMQRHQELHGRLPSPALVKAALTGAAVDLAGHYNADRSALMGHRPDRFQGYGRLNLDAAVNPPAQVLSFDQDHVFTDSGQSWEQVVHVDDPELPVQIMLVWTDAPGHGLGGDTPAWVNDLDLDVVAGTTRFLGNAIGSDGWSRPGGKADGKNNMEGVFLSPQQHGGGRLDLSVHARNIAADALNPHQPDVAAPRQDFALVCYNCSLTPSALSNLLFADGFETEP